MYDTYGPLQFHEILQHIDLGIYWALKTRDFQDNPPRTIPALKEHIWEGIDGKTSQYTTRYHEIYSFFKKV